MSAVLVQLCLETASVADVCVAGIAELAGLRVVAVKDLHQALAELKSVAEGGNWPVVLALSGSTALHLRPSAKGLNEEVVRELRGLASFFVYDFPPKQGTELLGQWVPPHRGASVECLPAGPMTYEFHEAAKPPLAGHSFTSMAAKPLRVFAIQESLETATILLSVKARPLLISHAHGGAVDYFLSEGPGICVDMPLTQPRSWQDYHAGVLPTALALKRMFAQYCWHNPFPAACMVIDDPLLQSRYGWFQYAEVLAELTAKDYTMTVAFIPSNYRRSDPQVAAQVARHANLLSICVHGCDHTGGEFGETNARSIESKSAAAMAHMEEHQSLTGLDFDSVMVFPQGLYSSCALSALKHCGYLAAVNTEPYPTDHSTSPITLADVFGLAMTRFDSFPLFTRHYPKALFDFAVDLFWGKPALVVEHHDYFRNGPGGATAFVNQLRQLDPRLEWLTLEKALIRSGHYQLIGPGSYAVKFVTATFLLRNPLPQRARFDCRKPESEPERILNATVDGKDVPYRMEAGNVCLILDLEAGEQRAIALQYKPYQACRVERSPKYKLKAFVRRRLSEFRDNHLARNERALELAKTLKRWLRA
ncbi:MAG: hypothetical protein ACLQVY_22565 [Limisphaerales bacterium]